MLVKVNTMGKPMTEQEKKYYQGILDKNGLGALSCTYYKLEKLMEPDYEGSKTKDWYVYDFMTISNGNYFVEYREERQCEGCERYKVYNRKAVRVSKDEGNKKYQELLAKGYTLEGKYVRDICGYSARL